ncbi:MAG TPA: alpha/beta hydrolase [Nitrososphaera sp.]|jgi:predicted esterase|nr:alpha/beta hydrolase [Nitrososphaera sp.]
MSVPTSSSSANKSDHLGFTHRYIPPLDRNEKAELTLLLLHGTGGNEDDLLPLGRELDPNAGLLSPRGKILEGGRIPRFFRRLAEGVFDIEDLKFRTLELAGFVEKASSIYEFDARRVIAVGYSNGANIAASMLLLKPQTLTGAILFRAMVPLVPDNLPDLSDKRMIMSSGLRDPIATRQEAERLSGLFKQAHAVVDLQWQNSGHELIQEDIHAAKQWLSLNKKQL